MIPFRTNHPGRWLGVGAIIGVGIFLVWLRWICLHDSQISFLDSRQPAEWILYDKPLSGLLHLSADLSTVFRRSLILSNTPASAILSVRAMKHWNVNINGKKIETETVGTKNWKEPTTIEVRKELHPGTNEILVTAFNKDGPPALWLALKTDEGTLVSDANWEASLCGAAWRKARLASRPPEMSAGNPLCNGERPWPSFIRCLPLFAVFAAVSAGLLAIGRWLLSRYQQMGEPWGPIYSWRFTIIALTVPALLWTLLFLNNLSMLPRVVGFDSNFHLQYINYIRTHGRLPVADEGWQMYQPPLYYLVASFLLIPFDPVGISRGAVTALRLFGLCIGIAQFTLIFLSLRLLFPRRVSLQVFGLVFAAFLPQNLYLAHYISNEGLAGALITGAIYFCLRILKDEQDSPRLYAGLGVCLGAGLLTKVTGIIAVPFIGVALFSRLYRKHKFRPLVWAGTVGLASVLMLAICGWYYVRVWQQFGSPFVGNWDTTGTIHWWMEDGFRTAAYYSHFGTCLISPWHSGYAGFFDGLYSTFWGDGLWAGMTSIKERAPWNYELMAAGYLLALPLTLLILIGTAAACKKLVCRPDPSWFVLMGVGFSTLAAILFMSVKLPYYAEVKSFYGLIAILPICAVAVQGWELVLQCWKPVVLAATVLFGVWALNSYTSFWIDRWDPTTQLTTGHGLADDGFRVDADQHYVEALRLAPSNIDARAAVAATAFMKHHIAQATQMMRSVLHDAPDDSDGHFLMSLILMGQKKLEPAIGEARRAIALAPDYPAPFPYLCNLLVKAGRNHEALAVGREGLRSDALDPKMYSVMGTIFDKLGDKTNAAIQFQLAAQLQPRDTASHLRLAMALAAIGRVSETVAEYRRVLTVDSNSVAALNNLAWILATTPEARLRNGKEATRLAERACELTGNKAPLLMGTLAAAYAEAGQFEEAVATAKQARNLALAAGQPSLAQKNVELIELFKQRRPYREKPEGNPHP